MSENDFDCTKCKNFKQKRSDNYEHEYENCDNFTPNDSYPIHTCFSYDARIIKIRIETITTIK